MTEQEPLPEEHLEGTRRSYETFLANVKLVPYEVRRQPDVDGLHHARIQIGRGVRFVEPYRLQVTADRPPYWFALSWQHKEALEALAETVRLMSRFCQGISKQVIEEELINLFSDLIAEERLSDEILDELEVDGDDHSERRSKGVNIGPHLILSNIRKRLHQMVVQLRKKAVPYIVYVPVEGLELLRSITIGDVIFERREAGCELEQVMDVMQERQGTRSIEWVRQDVIPEERVKCYAKIELVGEQNYVIEEASNQVSKAISILSLCIPSSLHRPIWAKINIADVIIVRKQPTSEPKNDWMGFFLAQSFGRVKRLNWNDLVDVIGARSTPRFASKPVWKRHPEQEDATVQQTLDGLLETFASGNEISKSIARALTWYRKAMGFTDPSEQFVALAIALDSLLGRRSSDTDASRASALSITQTISERVAFLLGEDYKDRMEKYDDTARLYGLRSKIVHEGLAVAEEDVFELEELLKDVILVFNAQGFTSWQRVQEWVTERVFTTDPNDAAAEGEE